MYNYYEKTKTIQLTRGDTMQMGFDFTVMVGSQQVTDYTAVWHLKKNTGLRYPLLDQPAVSVHARRCDRIDSAYRIQHLDRGRHGQHGGGRYAAYRPKLYLDGG
ncbi:hypothetical protein [Acidaminococcus timonensis]|uniref:hypothetical protein n=1 Tax=Acidaminococcus timonensis TaxID=1871002 RepID=UPI00307D4151